MQDVANTGDVQIPWYDPATKQQTTKPLSEIATLISVKAEDFRLRSKDQLALIDAMVVYSGQLTAIANSGKKDIEKTKAAGQAIQAFAESASKVVSHPAVSLGSEAVSAIAAASSAIIQEVKKAKTLKSMDALIKKHQAQVDKIAEALGKDIAQMSFYYERLDEIFLLAYDLANQGLIEYGKRLTEGRERLLLKMKAELDAGRTATLSNGTVDSAAKLADLQKKSDIWFSGYKQSRVAMVDVIRQSRKLIGQSASAIKAWKRAHKDLADAIRDARQPNAAAINAAADTIKAQIERVEKARIEYQKAALSGD